MRRLSIDPNVVNLVGGGVEVDDRNAVAKHGDRGHNRSARQLMIRVHVQRSNRAHQVVRPIRRVMHVGRRNLRRRERGKGDRKTGNRQEFHESEVTYAGFRPPEFRNGPGCGSVLSENGLAARLQKGEPMSFIKKYIEEQSAGPMFRAEYEALPLALIGAREAAGLSQRDLRVPRRVSTEDHATRTGFETNRARKFIVRCAPQP